MLTRIQIANYRCLKQIDVSLGPLTVLIGPNNTGKTAFLRAVYQLGSNKPGQVALSDRWNLDKSAVPSISGLSKDKERKAYAGPLKTQGKDVPPEQRVNWVVEGSGECVVPVSLFETPKLALQMVCPGFPENTMPAINDQASNVAAVFDLLLRKHRDRFARVLDTLRELIPGFSDLNVETPTPEKRRIDLILENDVALQADLASFGVRLLLFFVALANHPTPPQTVLIEEPETGVHPKRLNDIVRLLRGLSEGRYADQKTQVILTTHSPYLLDCIDIEKDQVLVLQREDDGSRNAHPVDAERLRGFLRDFMLGEIWFNQEESGLVKKDE